jgi:gliding motility-associated protein GldC
MKSEESITLKVTLDENKIPEKIEWAASGSGEDNTSIAKAFMLALWSEKDRQTLRMDLWTNEMKRDEMDRFFFETLMTMAETYQRANGDARISDDIKRFAYKFGERTKLIKQEEH